MVSFAGPRCFLHAWGNFNIKHCLQLNVHTLPQYKLENQDWTFGAYLHVSSTFAPNPAVQTRGECYQTRPIFQNYIVEIRCVRPTESKKEFKSSLSRDLSGGGPILFRLGEFPGFFFFLNKSGNSTRKTEKIQI